MNTVSPLVKKGAAFLFGLALAGLLPGMVAERRCVCARAAAPPLKAAHLSSSAAVDRVLRLKL